MVLFFCKKKQGYQSVTLFRCCRHLRHCFLFFSPFRSINIAGRRPTQVSPLFEIWLLFFVFICYSPFDAFLRLFFIVPKPGITYGVELPSHPSRYCPKLRKNDNWYINYSTIKELFSKNGEFFGGEVKRLVCYNLCNNFIK